MNSETLDKIFEILENYGPILRDGIVKETKVPRTTIFDYLKKIPVISVTYNNGKRGAPQRFFCLDNNVKYYAHTDNLEKLTHEDINPENLELKRGSVFIYNGRLISKEELGKSVKSQVLRTLIINGPKNIDEISDLTKLPKKLLYYFLPRQIHINNEGGQTNREPLQLRLNEGVELRTSIEKIVK